MLYHSYRPGPALAEYVDYLWLIEDAPAHDRERILPEGTQELVLNLRRDELRIRYADAPDEECRLSGAVVSGGFSRYFEIDAEQHASVMGAHFRPGGAFPFFRVGQGELTDTHVDLQQLWGPSAVGLYHQIVEADGVEHRFRLLEEALLRRLRPGIERHPAISLALEALSHGSPNLKVRDLHTEAGLSERRFIQLFAEEVGLAPKLFQRILRFRKALAAVEAGESGGWGEVALESGYFDQSHLIRDFREFIGLTPRALLARRSQDVKSNHVALAR
jgi:AraC-like DNA-binding protein